MWSRLRRWLTECFTNAPDRFHIQRGQPVATVWGTPWLLKVVTWHNITKADGSPGSFRSFILLWVIRWYWGNTKCDGTQTRVLWASKGLPPSVTDPDAEYVMNTVCSEGWSFRLSLKPAHNETWDSMGSI